MIRMDGLVKELSLEEGGLKPVPCSACMFR